MKCDDLAERVDIYLANTRTRVNLNPLKLQVSRIQVKLILAHLRLSHREDGMPATVIREMVAVMLTRMVAPYQSIMLPNPLAIPMVEIKIRVFVIFANRRTIDNSIARYAADRR